MCSICDLPLQGPEGVPEAGAASQQGGLGAGEGVDSSLRSGVGDGAGGGADGDGDTKRANEAAFNGCSSPSQFEQDP
jgi:hypothetical protein